MSASLVGSEMCIRDSHGMGLWPLPSTCAARAHWAKNKWGRALLLQFSRACLLYTSDAADDM
eukprot:2708521-Alexandrium_andersonii.AAC.1